MKLNELTVGELLRKFEAKQATSEEALGATLDAIEGRVAGNQALNAYITLRDRESLVEEAQRRTRLALLERPVP